MSETSPPNPDADALRRQVADLTRERDGLAAELSALHSTEERLRAIVNVATVGVHVSQHGLTKFVNDYVLNISGYTRDELAGSAFAEFVHPDDRGVVFDRHVRRIRGEEVETQYVFRALSKSGENIVVETTSVLIEWEGEPASLNFLRDVTKQRKAKAERHRSRRLEAIGTLAGGIAHDFNNILGQIIGFTDLARFSADPATRTTEHLERVMQASIRARDLVQRILSFARETEQVRRPISLDALVKSTDVLLRASFPSTVKIVHDTADRETTVLADPTQLEQVLVNLCTNACQAMEAHGGTLTVTVQPCTLEAGDVNVSTAGDLPPGDYVLLRVADTGQGMDEHTRERIFDPYFTTKRPGQGTGLGLAVAASIVEKHSGAIQVASGPGEGATFDVYLPRIPTDSAQPQTPQKSHIFRGTERILLVDDEEGLVDLGVQILGKFGYRVTGCTYAPAALKMFREAPQSFDLVITDLTMPELPGDRLAAELLSIRPDLPVILVTGYSQRMDHKKALAAGFAGYLKKPLDLPELTRTIRLVFGEKLPD